MSEPYIITTRLKGFINALKPGGKFDNCSIGFTIPANDLPYFEERYEAALKWGANKLNGKRHEKALPKWEEDGSVKYGYNGKDSAPTFLWVDAKGKPLDLSLDIREGTLVKLALTTKPYVYGNKVGMTLRVVGAQVIKLVTAEGSDGGQLDENELAELFGTTEGFDQEDTQYTPSQAEEEEEDDVPF